MGGSQVKGNLLFVGCWFCQLYVLYCGGFMNKSLWKKRFAVIAKSTSMLLEKNKEFERHFKANIN